MSIFLETESLRLVFHENTGALIRMEALETGWVIHRREELGLSFRMLVPINEELRNNLVYGEKQKLSEVQKEQNQVTFIWRNLYSERAGWLDITVTTTVRAEGPQAVWYTKVENHSPYPVEDLQSPCIGDLTRPQAAKWFRSFFYNYGTAEQASLWPCFDNQRGTHGVDVPTQYVGAPVCAPMGPFYLLRDKDQGLYVGIKSNSCEMVAYTCELHPGYDSSIDSRVPDMDTISGKPVYTFFSSVHMCYIQPGEVRDLTPVALEAYQGDWQKGADIYKAWRDTWMRAAKGPDWSEEPHSWLQLHINSPEDELRLRFTELPEVAKECAKYGVKAIQLVGWNQGGQDQGNPSHTPDPRLGTCEELKQAIADCQKFGVKIILFSKFTWADRGTQWFRQELIKDAIKDPYGDYYLHPGYQYQTPAQLLDINTKRLIPMCFGSRHYREVCNQEFQKLIELNCDGFLFDECLHHSPAALCFDESHGHRYGWPVYSEDRELIKEFQKKPGLRKDFLFSGEAVYDWEFEVYSLSYFRSWSKTHVPLSRYLRPHSQIMTAVNGFYDRNMINQCLMYRYIISYEPFNFKGWLHDYPETVAYGNAMDALRTELRKFFWDGEFQGTDGALVTTNEGLIYETYSVFCSADHAKGVIVCNYEDYPVSLNVSLEKGSLERWRLVDVPDWRSVSDGIILPPRSAAAVI